MTISRIRQLVLLSIMVLNAVSFQQISAMEDEASSEGSGLLTKLSIVIALPTAGFGYFWMKHYKQLHEIETVVDKSTSNIKSDYGSCFLFASWRSTPDNAPDGLQWDSPYWILQNKDAVKNVLFSDSQQAADRVFIYDEFEARISPVNVTQMQIKNAIADEKIRLEGWMQLVAGYTDMPQLIADQEGEDNRCLSAHEKALNCMPTWQEKTDIQLNGIIAELMNEVDSAPAYKHVFHVPSFWPTEWSFAPCYTKASRLYVKLFLLYARLCAIDTAVNS